MKIQVMFKMPDWDEQLNGQFDLPTEEEVEKMGTTLKDETQQIREGIKEAIGHRWLNYGECVTVEFDVENYCIGRWVSRTATVIQRNP